jgi:hypothetical protein
MADCPAFMPRQSPRVVGRHLLKGSDMNSPAVSKINWTQIAGFAASALIYFGVEVSAEQLAAIILGIQSAAALLTMVWRTWFTKPV